MQTILPNILKNKPQQKIVPTLRFEQGLISFNVIFIREENVNWGSFALKLRFYIDSDEVNFSMPLNILSI